MPREYTSPYLSDTTRDPIVIVCHRCQRRGVYAKASLLAKYGSVVMPDLLRLVAADGGCKLAIENSLNGRERCGVTYEL